MGSEAMGRRAFLERSLAGAALGGGPGGGPGKGGLAGKRVLVATGEFGESLETYCMLYRLREEGVEALVGAPRKKRLQLVVHDFEPGYDGYTEKPGYQIEADVAFSDLEPETLDGLLLPGGRAPEEIRSDRPLLAIVRHVLEAGKPLGAMCHGVMLIWTAAPIRGRRLTAYAGLRADIELLGGRFLDEPVVVDGSVVTSRGWPDLPAFFPPFLRLLRHGRP